MSVEKILELLALAAQIEPTIADALRRLLGGHPSAQRVRDILAERGASERAVDALRADPSVPR